MGGPTQPGRRPIAGRALPAARSHRLPATRWLGRMAHRPDLGHGVVPHRHRERLGALPLRALGMDRTLGLDLDRRRALGLCPLPLWALGADRAALVLGS